MRQIAKLTVVAILVVGLSGCGARGPKFEVFENNLSHDHGTVYFYRPNKFLLSGVSFYAMQIDRTKGSGFSSVVKEWKLRNNSHTIAQLEPGDYNLTTNWLYTPETFSIQPDKITCIRVDITIGDFFAKHPDLVLVDNITCEREMKETNLMTKEDKESIF